MIVYLLVIIAANVGLGYALIVYLNRRARFLSWSAQHVVPSPQAKSTTPQATTATPQATTPLADAAANDPALSALADARQLKATIDDGLSQMTRDAADDAASAPAEALASATS